MHRSSSITALRMLCFIVVVAAGGCTTCVTAPIFCVALCTGDLSNPSSSTTVHDEIAPLSP